MSNVDPSYIVFSSSDVNSVGMKTSDNIWSGQNSFTSNVSITAPFYASTANFTSGVSIGIMTASHIKSDTAAFTSSVSGVGFNLSGALTGTTANFASIATIATINTTDVNCLGLYRASGATGITGTFALASVATIVITSGIITNLY